MGIRLVAGDMLKPETYRDEVLQTDVAIHCAQLSPAGRYTRKSKERINAADRLMTETLAGACLQSGKALLYTSGCFNYGDYGADWINEETPARPSPLGEGHHAMVEYLMNLHHRQGLKVTVLTAGFVYGPGGLF
jgi:nucleoside-diphosphate-sugar epimerase